MGVSFDVIVLQNGCCASIQLGFALSVCLGQSWCSLQCRKRRKRRGSGKSSVPARDIHDPLVGLGPGNFLVSCRLVESVECAATVGTGASQTLEYPVKAERLSRHSLHRAPPQFRVFSTEDWARVSFMLDKEARDRILLQSHGNPSAAAASSCPSTR